ncbi:ribonuclease III domain-containing protein [Aspergillus pseudocaelatus]|uniref:Ribonuclease III domain-containing protein n=1 Tax=Aspergillus pseudocaelatus TaxID=1825620 RepID=A0ABQ6WMH1_9EURO|nr:ribonuclease III domain-containing protein [Aspergillus pseudocaelatus]
MTRLLIPTDTRSQLIEKMIDYTFTNPAIVHEALRTPGSIAILTPHRLDGHRDLAQLGDAALRLVLTKDGYQAHATREQINDTHSGKASNAFLARTGFQKGLDRYIYVNPSQDGIVSGKIMATTVEAILGAVYIDSGENIQAVRSVVAVLGLSWPA